jgi:hypothetical protein
MRTRTLLLATLVAGCAAASPAQNDTAPAEQYKLRVEYLYWSPQPAGQLQKGVSEIEGTLVDVREDLGFVEHAASPIRGALRLGRGVKLRGSWSPIDFKGEATASSLIVYGTTIVFPAQRIASSLKGHYVTAEIGWDFLQRPQGFLGLLVGVKYFDVDTLFLNVDTGDRVVETERLPIPTVGLASRVYLTRHLSVEGELSGLTLGDRGHVFELLAAARLHLGKHLAATGGYRRLVLEGRDGRDYLRVDLGTWTFGAEISL